MSATSIRIVVSPPGFSDWPGVLALLHSAYAYMQGRIDPPSSLLRMDIEQLRQKAQQERLILAVHDDQLIGCAFAGRRPDAIYIGKLAVHAGYRRRGIARALIERVEALARAEGLAFLELETRVELVENHRTFAALGFRKTAETAHAGYDRATAVTMRKALSALS